MIQPISTIQLNNSNTVFGGRIYSFEYTIGFGSEVSRMKMNVISPDGNYTISDNNMSYTNSVKITIGNKVFNMFLVSYNIEKSEKGRILEIEFDDTSSQYLDKLNILLANQYYNSSFNSQYIISLGDQYNSISTEGYNGIPETVYYIETPQYFNILKVPKVFYTPKQLLAGLLARVPCDNSVSNILNNPKYQYYRINYMGTIRDVLTRIGQDLAFNFYWNENEQLQFIDLSAPIQINAPTIANPVRKSQSSSLRGTFAYGTSSFYGVDGYTQQSFKGPDISLLFNYQTIDPITFGFPEGTSLQNALFQNLLKIARLGPDIFTLFFLVHLSLDTNLQALYGIQTSQITLQSNKFVYQEIQAKLGEKDPSLDNNPSLIAYVIPNGALSIISAAYNQFRAYGDTIGAVYICPMTKPYYDGYSYDSSFSWFNANTLILNTPLAVYYPQDTNNTLFGKFRTQPTIAPDPYAPPAYTDSDGYGVLIKTPSWDTSADITQLSQLNPPQVILTQDNNAILGYNDYLCYYNNTTNSSIYDSLLAGITIPTPKVNLTINGNKTNSLPDTYTVPRYTDTQFTDAPDIDVNKINFVPQEISPELVGLFSATFNIALNDAHALLSAPYIGYGQTKPLQSQTITVPGTTIPNITIAQGLERLEMTTNEQGAFTNIYLGNKMAQPIANTVTLDTLDNGIYVRAVKNNFFLPVTVGPNRV